MNKPTFFSIFGGLLVIIAANGKGFVEALQAALIFMVTLSTDAPLGVSSVLLAVVLAMLAMATIDRYMARSDHRALISDVLAFCVGFNVVWIQLKGVQGMLLGILAGLLAPVIYRLIMGLGTYLWGLVKTQGAPKRKR